jgi:DhnA family fructose-bisphosphate aldolase class Ia
MEYRLREFIRPVDQRCLMLDTSAGLALGALPGLDDFAEGVRPVMAAVDGLVCSPGQLRRISSLARGDAGLLVRADWTNTLRGSDFVLPPTAARWQPILSAPEALDLGAVGMVSTFLLGYEEEVEAECLRATVQWSVKGRSIGIPLVVEVRADGPRVSLAGKAVELGASYALESGAEVVVVPYPGPKSLETIAAFVSVPWLVKPDSLEEAPVVLDEVVRLGGAGLWLDHRMVASRERAVLVGELWRRLHPTESGDEDRN